MKATQMRSAEQSRLEQVLALTVNNPPAAWSPKASSFATAKIETGSRVVYLFRCPARPRAIFDFAPAHGFRFSWVDAPSVAALGVDVLELAEVPASFARWEFWSDLGTTAPKPHDKDCKCKQCSFIGDLRRRLREQGGHPANG